MEAQQVQLHGRRVSRGNVGLAGVADARRDSVHALFFAQQRRQAIRSSVQRPAPGFIFRERQPCPATGHRDDLFDRQGLRADKNSWKSLGAHASCLQKS
jgi:hypothetical protein